jgi:TRAP-type transport system periplasmic protein
MSKRRVLLSALCFLSALSFAAPSRAQTVMKLGHAYPAESQYGAAARAFAAEVAKGTNNRYKIEENPANALGDDNAMVEGVQLGTVDLWIGSSAASKMVSDVGLLGAPFLFRDAKHVDATLDGPIGKTILDKFSTKGVVGLAWLENGFRSMTNSKRPIKTPADLKGLKIRAPANPVIEKALNAMGATAQQLSFSQLYNALKDGQVDGQENPIATIVSAKFNEVQKHLSLTDHVYSPAVLVINGDLYKGLSDADKAVFVKAAAVASKISRDYARKQQQEGVETLRKGGMDVVTQVDRPAFEKSVASLYAELAAEYKTDLLDKVRAVK